MNRICVATFGLLFSVLVLAEEPAKPSSQSPDARAIVQKSAEAIGKLKVVAYDLEYEVTGWFSAFMPKIHGRIVMCKETPQFVKRFRCTLKIEPAGSEAVELTAGANGDVYYLIDDKSKTVYADIDPQVFGKHRSAIDFSLTREFGMAKPFYDVLNGGELRYERAEKVDGEDCHVLHLKSQTEPATLWFFSERDHLPRRVLFSMKDAKGEVGAGEATMHKLDVNPKFDKDPFELVVPQGYKKTDEFAP